jgi:hypothetical protein
MGIGLLQQTGLPALAVALTAAWSTACSPAPGPVPDDAGLPAGVLAAFHDHIDTISDGALVCRDPDIAAAAQLSGRINADDRPDFIVDTRALNCTATRDGPAVAYFCGTGTCAFPLLVSDGEGWRPVVLMFGHEARIVEHYQETRIEIREGARGVPGGAVTVREYAWRDGRLVRIGEWLEAVEADRAF